MVARIRSPGLRVPVALRRWDQLTHPAESHPTTSHLTASNPGTSHPTAPHPTAPQSKASETAGSTVSMPRKRGRRRSSGRSHTALVLLSFSVSYMKCLLREGHYSQRLSSSAPLFLAPIMQQLIAKVLELAGNEAQNSGQRCVTPELVGTVVQHNALLSSSFGMTTISLVAPAQHQLLNHTWVLSPGCPAPGWASHRLSGARPAH